MTKAEKTITTDDWNLMEDKIPNYYSLIIALVEDNDPIKCGYDFVCVWRASDDEGEDCYNTWFTANVLKGKIIKWAYLEIDDETESKL
jgi:hypothetical protein